MLYFSSPLSKCPRPAYQAPMRTTVLSVGFALAIAPGIASAQTTGLEAYNAYVAGLKDLGFTVEDGAINYDGTTDTLTISDASVGFKGVITDLPAEGFDGDDADADASENTNLSYDLSLSSGTVKIEGLSEDNNVFSAGRWSYSDDTSLSISAAIDGEGRFLADARLAGAKAENYSFTIPALPVEAPDKQASRWLPFVKTLLQASYDEIRVDTTAMTLEAYADEDGNEVQVMSGTVQLDGYLMAGAVDGKIARYSLDKMTQTLETRDETSGQTLTQTTSQGKTVYQDMDANALIALLDPDVPETGDEVTVIRTASAVDYSTRQDLGDGTTIAFKIDRSSMDDLTFVKRENDFLDLMDKMIAGDLPEPVDIITNVFQIYRSFAIADARVSGIDVSIEQAGVDTPAKVTIKEAALTNVSSDGIGEMMLVGVAAPDLPEGAAMSLEWAALGDIEFADFAPMESMIETLIDNPDYGEENPLDVLRAFMPRSISYEVEGLKVAVPDAGVTSVNRAEMRMASTVPPIPTSYYAKNDGIQIPAKALGDPEVEAFLEALGISEIIWSDETRLYWDEATKELNLERLTFEMEGVGRAEASARFGNVPKELFEDPEGQGQMALIVAQFIDARIRFVDDGVTENGLAHIANDQNIPVNVFREAMIEQAVEIPAPIQNAAFTEMVRSAVSEFLENPGEITLSLKPQAPVPLAQIVGSLAAPQTLPNLLNIQVKAN